MYDVPAGTPAGVTVKVPGETTDAVWLATTGVWGWVLIVTIDPVEMQPAELFAVTVYVPGETELNTPDVLV